MQRATSISGISAALSPQPLVDESDFRLFYGTRFESTEADTTAIIELHLAKSHGAGYDRRFLTGHSGTGKSTELTRLSLDLAGKFEFLRLSAQSELSPFSTQPFDLLEVMAIRLAEQADKLELGLDEALLERLQAWFVEITESKRIGSAKGVNIEAEAGAKAPALLKSILSLGAIIKGDARFSSSRTEESVRKRLQRLADLRDLVNDLFIKCNEALRKRYEREWVFLIEDLDKNSVSEAMLKQLFVTYTNIWRDLRVHFVCTIPLWLAFGENGASLPFDACFLVDIPVFDPQHRPYTPGRRILRQILEKRVDPNLFAPGAMDYIIQAAGGNLRDMFRLVTEAATFAELRKQPHVGMEQAARAVNGLRNDYLKRLGDVSMEHEIPYERKTRLLVEIYHSGASKVVQDSVLYRLLRSRVVHEYNDTYWYGLPPIVVDILIQQGVLKEGSPGGLETTA